MPQRSLISLFLLFLVNVTAAQDTVTLQLKWWHQFQFAGFYAAQAKGFYAAEGLVVNIVTGDPGHSPTEEVVNGNATFGVTGSDLLVEHSKGAPVVALGVIFQHSPYIIISPADKQIRTPFDLVGKRVMASNSQGEVHLMAMLLKEGISPDSVEIIPHTWNNDDLVNGKADAMTGYVSVEPYQLKKSGIEVSTLVPRNYGIDFYGDVLFTTQTLAEENPELAERFMRASFKGWTYAMDNPHELAEYILALPGVRERGVTLEMLLSEASEMAPLISNNIVEVGHMNPGRWQHILTTYQQLGLIAPAATTEGFLYEKKKSFFERNWRSFLFGSIALLGLLLLLAFNIYTMKKLVRKKTIEVQEREREKHKTEQELKKHQDVLEMAVESGNIATWDWNVPADTFEVDGRWHAMLGYRKGEIPQGCANFIQLVHPDDRSVVQTSLGQLLERQKEKHSIIFRIKTKNRGWKWVLGSCKSTQYNAERMPVRITGINVDVDLMKNKEKELYALSRELMRSNKELQQFAYITSHNLRSPVANITSLVRMMRKSNDPAFSADLLEKIDFCAGRLDETLSDLNTILTASPGFEKEPQAEVLFSDRLQAITGSIGEFIRSTGTTINADFSRLETIRYPEKVLDSIFLNLVTNAIKYRSALRPPVIDITTYIDSDEYAVLEVSDNGSGIDLKKHLHKMFRLYQRFHENPDGKGIGLYLVRSQVESMEGVINVSSEPGKGTTFTVYFKRKPRREEEHETEALLADRR